MATKTTKTEKATKAAKATKTAKIASAAKKTDAAKQRLYKKDLNAVLTKMPRSLLDHCNRIKFWATFLVERVQMSEEFCAEKLKPKLIVDAISFHDIGKYGMPASHTYIDEGTSEEAAAAYRTHAAGGAALIEKKFDYSFEGVKANTFASYLYLVLTEHHERIDGSGFPTGRKGEELSTVGKLAAIVDTFDNLLYPKNGEMRDPQEVIAALREQSGVTLDKSMTDAFLEDPDHLVRFIDYVGPKGKVGRAQNADYGVKILCRPIFDIRENRLYTYMAETVLMDPYLGMTRSSAFMEVARKSRKLNQLEKLAFERLCIEIDRRYDGENDTAPFIFPISAQTYKKDSFLTFAKRTAKRYEIPENQIWFAISDAEMSEDETNWADLATAYRNAGFRLVIRDFGDSSSFFGQYSDVTVECICMRESYTKRLVENPKFYSIISGLVQIAYSLQIKVMFGEVDKRSVEGELMRLGARYAYGDLYGAEQILKEGQTLLSEGSYPG